MLVQGMMKALLADGGIAQGRRACSTMASSPSTRPAFEALARRIEALELEQIDRGHGSGLPRDRIEAAAAQLYANAKATILCYGMGLTQHRDSFGHGPAIGQSAAAEAGNIGRPGAGICPMRGPLQRPGATRTVGIWEKPPTAGCWSRSIERRLWLRTAR